MKRKSTVVRKLVLVGLLGLALTLILEWLR
jgi:hypothetical protein